LRHPQKDVARGSTFIYVPQKRGTPLIGSNVATVLCLHKKFTE